MRNLLALTFSLTLALTFSLSVRGQCTTQAGFICISQDQANRTDQALAESLLKDKLIAAYKALGTLTDSERAAFQNALKATTDAFDARGKVIADMDHINALQQKVIEMYSALVEKLTAQINKPRSGWQKFLSVLEKILYIAVGAGLAHGL